MAAVAEELFESRQTGQQSARRRYLITSATSDVDAASALLTEAPTSVNGLSRNGFSVDEIKSDTYEGEVSYGAASQEIGSFEVSFDAQAVTTHITHSKETIASYSTDSGGAPDMKNAIGVDEDGNVTGCDIYTPQFSFSKTLIADTNDVDTAYINGLMDIIGHTNNATFEGFAAGEVLALGARGSKSGYDRWTIAFQFICSPNVTGLAVGDMTGIAKKGWEYLWVYYETDDDGNGATIATPKHAYVERVYDAADFSGLEP